MPEILLSDGSAAYKYVVLDPITEYQPDVLTEAFRTSGVERREDNTKLKRLFFSGASHIGQGVLRMKREFSGDHGHTEPLHAGTLYTSNAETRFSTAMALPALNETETHASPLDHLIAKTHFKGDLYGLFEEDYDATAGHRSSLLSAKYVAATDTWGPGGIAQPGNSSSGETSGAAASVSSTHSIQTTYGNRVAFALVSIDAASAATVTYDGEAMTLFTSAVQTGGTPVWTGLFYKIDPNSGSVTVTASHASAKAVIHVLDCYNVNQTTPLANAATQNEASSTTSSVTPAGRRGDLTIGGGGHANSNTHNEDASQTEIGTQEQSGLASAASYERNDGTDPAFTYSWTTNASHASVAAAIQSVGGITYTEADDEGVRGFGMSRHKGELYVIGSYGVEETQYRMFSTTDGNEWDGITPSGTNWPTTAYLSTGVTRVNNWRQKYADVMGFGNNLIVALYEDPDSSGGSNSQIRIGYSPDLGATWTFDAGLIIPCSDTPNIKLTTINDPFQATTPVVPALITSDGIYTLDLTAGSEVFAPVLADGTFLSGQANDALGADRAADGALYLGTEIGDMMKITVEGPGRVVPLNVGPSSQAHGEDADGLPADRIGYPTSVWGGNTRWLFVAYGGHAAATYAQIFAMDYKTLAWHTFFLAEDGDIGANVDINLVFGSLEDDGVPRLHAASEGSSASTCFMFENYHASPVSTLTKKYKAAGYLNWSEDDLINPHQEAAIMRILMDAYDLSATTTNEHVDVQYGINGADWENVALTGDFLSGTKVLNFGTNGEGVAAKTVRIRMNLKRGSTNTKSPKIVDWELWVYTRQERLKGFVVNVDLAASAKLQRTTAETVVSRLNTTIKSVVAVPFEWAGTGTLYVHANRHIQGETSARTGRVEPTNHQRTSGIYPVTLEEPVEV